MGAGNPRDASTPLRSAQHDKAPRPAPEALIRSLLRRRPLRKPPSPPVHPHPNPLPSRERGPHHPPRNSCLSPARIQAGPAGRKGGILSGTGLDPLHRHRRRSLARPGSAHPTGKPRRFKTTPDGLRSLVERRTPHPRLIAFEASGGYERPLADTLTQAQLPFVILNPRNVRYHARSTWPRRTASTPLSSLSSSTSTTSSPNLRRRSPAVRDLRNQLVGETRDQAPPKPGTSTVCASLRALHRAPSRLPAGDARWSRDALQGTVITPMLPARALERRSRLPPWGRRWRAGAARLHAGTGPPPRGSASWQGWPRTPRQRGSRGERF